MRNGLKLHLRDDVRVCIPPELRSRRGAGVVERGGLENRCGCKPTQGSNPCLSAIDLFRSITSSWLII